MMTPALKARGARYHRPRVSLMADLDSRTVWQRVQADADSALASGACGTPTLFINGRRHLAGYDQATLRAALHAAIKET